MYTIGESKMLPRIVFFGSSDFSAAVLADLYQKGFPIPLVVTQPDKPFGRKRVLHPPPVKIEAQKLGIRVVDLDKLADMLGLTPTDLLGTGLPGAGSATAVGY